MLVGFSVENFKSFNQREILKMCAGKGRKHKTHYVDYGDKKILKSAVIFGGNASGKSNLIDAIAFSRNIIINGIYGSINNNYYKIEDKNIKKAGIFDYDLIIDNKEYSYGIAVSYEESKIISEWLYLIKNEKEVCIFNREIKDDGEYIVDAEGKYQSLKEQYFNNFNGDVTKELSLKTILNDVATRNKAGKDGIDDILKINDWFNEKLLIIYPELIFSGRNQSQHECLKSVGEFDTGIEKITYKTITKTLDNLLEENFKNKNEKYKKELMKALSLNGKCEFTLIDGSRVLLENDINGKVKYEKIEFDHGNPNNLFQYYEESDGTKRLMDLLPFFETDEETTIIVDEIDRSLHTILLREFLNRFYLLCKGEKKQLIMTTHDTNIMDLKLLRQDEIWFVERNKDHSSSLFSLNKYKVHFDTVAERNYLMGRYGGLPIINQILSNEEEEDVDE